MGYGRRYPRRCGRWYSNEYQILKERYSKGEITKEQFEQMAAYLQKHEDAY